MKRIYQLLVADDEVEARSSLCCFFPWADIGFEVIGQVCNGREVIDFIHSRLVDVILCDIKMPLMDGIAVAKYVYENNLKIKMVFISGYRDFSYVKNALRYGVRDYILKPTKYDEIVCVFDHIRKELDAETVSAEDTDVFDISAYPVGLQKAIKNILSSVASATLEYGASLMNMNPSYFSQYFKKHTGMNFSDFLTAEKMKKASIYLKEGMKISEISSLVGYSSPKAFSRAFSAYYGCSPNSWRHGE